MRTNGCAAPDWAPREVGLAWARPSPHRDVAVARVCSARALGFQETESELARLPGGRCRCRCRVQATLTVCGHRTARFLPALPRSHVRTRRQTCQTPSPLAHYHRHHQPESGGSPIDSHPKSHSQLSQSLRRKVKSCIYNQPRNTKNQAATRTKNIKEKVPLC